MDATQSNLDWWRSGVVYQIYPRSFADGNGDGTGDIIGVTSRLGYLKELGIDAVWFSPWYLSPLADGGYDVTDYRQIDPRFGSLADAEEFIRQAADLGIRTIVDIVPNHVSDQHPWFQAALASEPGSQERSRFWFHDGREGDQMPTNWLSSFRGRTWTRTTNPDGLPGQWYLHLFTAEQPDLNWNHPDVRAEHEEILKFWFDRGVAGVRVDSAVLIVKDPSLPDDPTLLENHDPADSTEHPFIDRDGIHDIYRSWRTIADSYDPPRIMVGEVWLPDAKRFAAYLRPDEMHTAFNFDFMARPWDASELMESIDMTLTAHAPVNAPPTWVLSNHDVTRPVTRLGREDTSFSFEKKRFGTPTDLDKGNRRARAAFMLCAALPGSLYIYQGDELGLPEVNVPKDAIEDPMHFRSEGIDPGRDGCRVPLPWTQGPADSFGFSSVQGTHPWMPQPEWWGDYCVERQENDPESMLSFYRKVLSLRRSIAGLNGSDFEWYQDLPATCLGFKRGSMVCIVNFGTDGVPLPDLSLLLSSEPVKDSIGCDTAVWLTQAETGHAGRDDKGGDHL